MTKKENFNANSIKIRPNFRAPDLIREKFSGGPDIKGT